MYASRHIATTFPHEGREARVGGQGQRRRRRRAAVRERNYWDFQALDCLFMQKHVKVSNSLTHQ